MNGKIKMYYPEKGYGFIKSEDGTGDVFFHHSDIKDNTYRVPKKGDRVCFDIAAITGDKRSKAINIRKLNKKGNIIKNIQSKINKFS